MRCRSGDKQWFDASCRSAYDAKQTAYRAWFSARNSEHWGQFVLARAEAQKIFGAARKWHNEHTRNTLKVSPTCSHKWWETLKGSIFGVKPISALRGPGGGLVVAPAEKASLLGSQFNSKQCREQFVALAFRTSVLLRILLDLDTCVSSIFKEGEDMIA